MTMPDHIGKYRYFTLHKPYGVLSQFTPDHPGQRTLAELGSFPRDVYPVGRLDADSEGLIVLTNDNVLKCRILDPVSQVKKTYWAQVEGEPIDDELTALRRGISIRIKGQAFHTAPAEADFMAEKPVLSDRNPPVRFRRSIPDCWVQIVLTEGKNRQVRRMLAAVGLPVIRLVRYTIGDLSLDGHLPGEIKEWNAKELYNLIFRQSFYR